MVYVVQGLVPKVALGREPRQPTPVTGDCAAQLRQCDLLQCTADCCCAGGHHVCTGGKRS